MFRRASARIGLFFAFVLFFCTEFFGAESTPAIRMCPDSSLYQYRGVADHTYLPVRSYGITESQPALQSETWSWQMFPDGHIYPNYLAAIQNRLACSWNYDPDIDWNWDITLGGRSPILRYGNRSAIFPEGWQIDLEGSVHLRLALMNQMDMEANDFRVGLPVSYGTKIWQIRMGYYHVSTHTGDERMLRYFGEPNAEGNIVVQGDPAYSNKSTYKNNESHRVHRLNYYREALLFGYAYKPTPNTRVYAELDYAFMRGELTKPFHFQFGGEYSPVYPAREEWGTPFLAVNIRLMEEHDFDGNFTLQTGWQWRGARNQLFRLGIQYFNGVSDQYSFLIHKREHKVGLGIWHDF